MRALAENIAASLLKEQFVPDHLFVYFARGSVRFFDGNKKHIYTAGESCLVRKNSLIKFSLPATGELLEPILFCFDEPFLKEFRQKYQPDLSGFKTNDVFIRIGQADLLDDFIRSLRLYHKGVMQLDEAFEDLKYEELLLILLRIQPELSGVLFDFAMPGKLNLAAFMNRNYRFNVSLSRFAYLTGRSLSAFKRDFKAEFGDTPGHWLVKKRLQEAYVLMDQKDQKPSDIYLDLGFESLSHFSVAFKKLFGYAPAALMNRKNITG